MNNTHNAEKAHMPYLDAGDHEPDCKRFPTGWLCTTTCPVMPSPPGSELPGGGA